MRMYTSIITILEHLNSHKLKQKKNITIVSGVASNLYQLLRIWCSLCKWCTYKTVQRSPTLANRARIALAYHTKQLLQPLFVWTICVFKTCNYFCNGIVPFLCMMCIQYESLSVWCLFFFFLNKILCHYFDYG